VNLLLAEWNPVTSPAVQIAVMDDNATAVVVHFLMTLPYIQNKFSLQTVADSSNFSVTAAASSDVSLGESSITCTL
jgi:hypothetical protein